ncbi:unnamed protein product [Sympodiomycopsis kandeliae]
MGFQLAQFKAVPSDSKTWRLWLCVFFVGLSGAARGLDEGIISNEVRFKSFQESFGITSSGTAASNIISLMTICAIGGSLLAFALVDTVGRLRTLQISCLFWMVGTAIWISSDGRLGQLYAGRAIAGLGVGFTPVAAPIYLSEVTPSALRGLSVLWYAGNVYTGIVLGYFTNYGTSTNLKPSAAQWQIPISLNFMVGSIILIGTFFIVESPRYLLKKGQTAEAQNSLAFIRNRPKDHPELRGEADTIAQHLDHEREATKGSGPMSVFKELFFDRTNGYKLFLCLFIQVFGQMSGGGSFTVFAPKFFELLGKTGNVGLLTTGLFGIVKLVVSLLCAVFVIDLLGRKRAVTTGIAIQGISALYLALYLKINLVDKTVTAENASEADKRAADAGIFFIFMSGVGWALGINAIQYLISSEIFPLRVRAAASGISMTFHWAFQFCSSRTVNPMIEGMNTYGAFLFYFAICVILLLFVIFFLPETSGFSLEEMDEIFEKPWYKIGLSSSKPYRGPSTQRISLDDGDVERAEDHHPEMLEQHQISRADGKQVEEEKNKDHLTATYTKP